MKVVSFIPIKLNNQRLPERIRWNWQADQRAIIFLKPSVR